MNVGRSRVDLGSQGFGAILEIASLHSFQKVRFSSTLRSRHGLSSPARVGVPRVRMKSSADRSHTWAFPAQESTPEHSHAGFSNSCWLKRFIPPLKTQPRHILHDGIHILGVLASGIGIIKAKVAGPLRLLGNAKIQTDGLGVTDVEEVVERVPAETGSRYRCVCLP